MKKKKNKKNLLFEAVCCRVTSAYLCVCVCHPWCIQFFFFSSLVFFFARFFYPRTAWGQYVCVCMGRMNEVEKPRGALRFTPKSIITRVLYCSTLTQLLSNNVSIYMKWIYMRSREYNVTLRGSTHTHIIPPAPLFFSFSLCL